MTADIVEGAHDLVLAAHDEGALASDVEGRPVAVLGHVTHMAGELPMAAEELILLDLEELLVEIGPGRQARTLIITETGWRHWIDRIHFLPPFLLNVQSIYPA